MPSSDVPQDSLQTSLVPLCVDLDGTLVRTDLLVESVLGLVKQNILYLFLLPFWLLKGKAHFKHEVARRVELDTALLPYDEPFLAYLREQHKGGRQLILATASNVKLAEAVANYLGLFEDVLASDEVTNNAGGKKLARLLALFGDGKFDYAGNAKVDISIWAHANEAVVVSPLRGVRQAAERQGNVSQVFDEPHTGGVKAHLKAMRPHQWLKNLLVFVPLATAHQADDPILLGQAALAFVAFNLCASSVYLLNDLLDLSADRQHPTKRNRPFAAGTIPIVSGLALIPVLLALSALIALWLPAEFVMVLSLYYLMTLGYSLWFKRLPLIDVLVLAGLYTIRIMAGAAAVSVIPSFWLLAFSMFLFMSLALVKRYTELLTLSNLGQDTAKGRGYNIIDLETLAYFGSSSAYMAVLVLAFYINSDAVKVLYARPEVIWLLCPLLLYLISRIWLLARRDELHEDPVMFVIQDRHSQALASLGIILLWLAV